MAVWTNIVFSPPWLSLQTPWRCYSSSLQMNSGQNVPGVKKRRQQARAYLLLDREGVMLKPVHAWLLLGGLTWASYRAKR